ncbi:hypothetical protein B0H21DRAFT_764282 [Amylocystis lapponica]|nr:hypothetical protein B0H21DRAFT_764282 [Amylocystis lapponica]
MPSVRKHKNAEPSTSTASSSRTHPTNSSSRPTHKKPTHKQRNPSQDDAGSLVVPGVQKLKAALRQTRRLLAKDNLAADVRRVTERRERALEADLAQAEQARTERAMAARYHMVKFFERQKVMRRLQQTKRQLAQAGSDNKARRTLEERLAALRIDLNYIIHYPKTKKYISLFPPEARRGAASNPELAKEDAGSGTAAEREALRLQIRERMFSGELSAEPELDTSRQKGSGRGMGAMDEARGKTKDDKKVRSMSAKVLSDDAFFGDDNDDEVDEGGGQADGDDGDDNEESEASDGDDDDVNMDD